MDMSWRMKSRLPRISIKMLMVAVLIIAVDMGLYVAALHMKDPPFLIVVFAEGTHSFGKSLPPRHRL